MSEGKLDILHHGGLAFENTRADGLYTIRFDLIVCASSRSPVTRLVADALLTHRRCGHVDLSKVDSA